MVQDAICRGTRGVLKVISEYISWICVFLQRPIMQFVTLKVTAFNNRGKACSLSGGK